MKGSSNASSGGIGMSGLLLVLFVALKLIGIIDWSWWWVLAPAWIPAAFLVVVLMVFGVMLLVSRK